MSIQTIYIVCLVLVALAVIVAGGATVISKIQSGSIDAAKMVGLIYDQLVKKIATIVNEKNQMVVMDEKMKSPNGKLSNATKVKVLEDVIDIVTKNLTEDERIVIEHMFPAKSEYDAIHSLIEEAVFKNHTSWLSLSSCLADDSSETPMCESEETDGNINDCVKDDPSSNDSIVETPEDSEYNEISPETHRNNK